MEEEKKARRKALRDSLSLNVCGGDDVVADELLSALELVQDKTVAALNAGSAPSDLPAYMEDVLLKQMTQSAVLRKWFGPRSPREFAHTFITAMFGTQQGAPGRGGAEQPGVIPSILASGKYGAMGSGFHVSTDGWIITNQHVVESASSVDIRDAWGEVHAARVVKTDQTADLALLKTSATSKEWLSLSQGEASLGTHVFTIGYPRPSLQGIEPKFTDGSISSLKGLRDDAGTYQISVPLQPGNSGGALVHLESGWVVGVVVSVLPGPQSQNVNYAVKSKLVRALLEAVPEARSVLASPPPAALDPGAIIDKVKSATVLVLVPRN
jgi:S1-C subfamily serine protease